MVRRSNSKLQKSVSSKAKATKTEVPTNPKNSKSKDINIPNIKTYLIPDMIDANFVRSITAKDSIDKLIETGDLKYLRSLSTNQMIYREDVFWEQILQWNISAFYGDKNAQMLLDTVAEGVKRAIITYKHDKKVGRPSKLLPYDLDILIEYEKVQRTLLNNTITNSDLIEITNLQSDATINKRWAKNRIRKIKERRIKCLNSVFKNLNIEFTEERIGQLVLTTNAQISY